MKRSLSPLGETEMEVLHIVWNLGEASVAEVHEEILKTRKAAYTTIMTVMKNLAEKDYLTFRKEGMAYIYSASKPETEVKHSLLRQMLDKVFKGSPAELVQTLVEHESLSGEEKAQIEALIKKLNS